MSSFLDKFIADTYNGILHSDIGLDETSISQIFDGDGNKSALSLGRENNGGKITGPLVSTSSTVEQNLSVGGGITANNISSSSINTDSIVINNSLRASNVNYPVSDNLTSLFALIYPIGSIYLNAVGTNPGIIFSGTTWRQISQGRFLVGVGTGNDGINSSQTFAPGNSQGVYKHQITIDEMPRHNHTYQTITDANVNREFGETKIDGYFDTRDTSFVGGDQPHTNIPPSFGVYIWQRTA